MSVAARSAKRFEHGRAPLRRAVVGDDELDSAALGRAQRDLDPRQRPALDGLLGRLAEDLVERDRGVLPELVGVLDVEVDLDLVA